MMNKQQQNFLKITKAHQNNLKGFDLKIPLNRITAVTGVSGSGKSSLAFDTLYAEGQRRYIETFSPYARQFMERMDKPRVEKIEGIPPAIAIEHGNPVKTSRSTVGTITEVTDFTKLLFARIGELHCSGCSRKVIRDTPETIRGNLKQQGPEARMVLAFPYPKGDFDPEVIKQEILRQGFYRVLEGDIIRDIKEPDLDPAHVSVVVDRFTLKTTEKSRIIDSIEQALRFGQGQALVRLLGKTTLRFSTHLHCPYCNLSYKDPVPNLFSFNSPLGACPNCRGFGRIIDLDLDQVIPDRNLTLEQGAVKPWGVNRYEYFDLINFCAQHNIPANIPFHALDEQQQQAVINGTADYYGIRGFFKRLEGKAYKMHVRVFLSRYRGYFTCPECNGTRLKAESLLYKINGFDIAHLHTLSIGMAYDFITHLADDLFDGNHSVSLPPWEGLEDGDTIFHPHSASPTKGEELRGLNSYVLDEATRMIVGEITSRLKYLNDVGLSYLTLDRQSRTLSGGEVERVSLTKALGSSLVNTLYVLDEPSIGLHPRDSLRLVNILKKLSEQNTVVVVEHDPEIIQGCDHLLDLGPKAGEAGGNIVYFGPFSQISRAKNSLTIDYLTGRVQIPVPRKRRKFDLRKSIRLHGCKAHNLKNITITIPLGLMVCLTGVSGSGKSTLAEDILYKGTEKIKGNAVESPGAYQSIEGLEHIDSVVLIDQSPIGKTPRSNPISYIGALDPIRTLFAKLPLARERNYKPGMFSFNVAGGRCETCQGNGFEKVEMQFLSDVFITCPECSGLRYKKEILEIIYQGKNISDILQMTFTEAREFFLVPKIRNKFQPLIDVGLGYLRLGQPINTLSGGEAQRLKLTKHLAVTSRKPSLFIFDEPTTGLHFDDIKKLLGAFQRLIEAGHSLLIIEHNMEVVKCADYVIDLGPEGGDEGGTIVAEGTPEEVAGIFGPTLQVREAEIGGFSKEDPSVNFSQVDFYGNKKNISYTGRFLKKYLKASYSSVEIKSPPGTYQTGNYQIPAPVKSNQTIFDTIDKTITHNDKVINDNKAINNNKAIKDNKAIIKDKPINENDAINNNKAIKDNRAIQITGARVHNLKNLTVTIPRDQMIVITGLSGSGKSSLAFDVLFAEGQRRYIESLPTYIRQYLKIMERPDIDFITGLPPTVAIEQRMSRLQRRSTVATVTEIYHYLRLLFSKTGIRHCQCGKPLSEQTEEQMLTRIMEVYKGKEVLFLAPKISRRKGIYKDLFELAIKKGYPWVRIDDHLTRLDTVPQLERYKEHTIDLGIQCMKVSSKNKKALTKAIEKSLLEGRGVFYVLEAKTGQEEILSRKGFCPKCNTAFEPLDPRLFSFNSRYGACPACNGQGVNPDSGKVCDQCRGKRLNEQALAVKIANYTIADMASLSVDEALRFFPSLHFSDRDRVIAKLLIPEIITRLEFLSRVGLPYLTLDRSGNTLSGGETQRIRLAAQLGSNLRGVCYILDEPTIGLHPRDNAILLDTLYELKTRGNSVIIVEHDEETIRRADCVIDLGPGAGRHGGRLVAQGTTADIQKEPASLTGKSLALPCRRKITSRGRQAKEGQSLIVKGARLYNLKNIEVTIPLGTLVCLTGVSGSGKSTLLREVIWAGIRALLNRQTLPENICQDIEGWQHLERILEVDHAPIGKTPRSTPGTYIGFHDEIRKFFAQLPESRMRGYQPRRFSFNVKGGRCEACSGGGRIKEEMSFLPDVYIDCEVCRGLRFNEETLTITYRGKNIGQVLELTIEEGLNLFSKIPKIARPLKLLMDMGLGYLRIGQPSNTLSGGEAQRIKLAYELCKMNWGRTMYILDEPTTGLHSADIEKLMNVLQQLVDLGNTIVIIEHNLEVIKEADHIIDLGPEGGDKGGSIVVQGPPRKILTYADRSYTARFLRKYLK